MSTQSTKFALAVVGKLKERLGQVPANQVAEVSKQGAIDMLVPELHEMRAKGYTWRAIAGLLSEEGLQVTTAALQGYIRRARAAAGGATKDGRKGKRPRPSGERTPQGGLSRALSTAAGTGLGAASSEATHAAAGVAVGAPAPGVLPPKSGTLRSSFTPRRHSEDI